MDMDLGTSLVGLVIVLMVIIPIVLASCSIKNKEKRFLQSLFKLAEKHKCTIIDHDHWNNTAIGIDNAGSKLFFIRKRVTATVRHIVDLTGIKPYRIIHTSRIINMKTGNQSVIDDLGLGFMPGDSNSNEIILEFFNSDYDSSASNGESKLLEKWSQVVKSALAKSGIKIIKS
jgi:hypothetical protein